MEVIYMTYEQVSDKACLEINKISSFGTLTSKMNHNFRLRDVINADPERMRFNEELVKEYGEENLFELSSEERKEKIVSFKERFERRIEELDYYKTHKVRSNAVLAYEINLTYSPTADVPIEKWKDANYEWLKETFNVAPDKNNNVLSCVYHGDENNGHIHAIVIPINSEGKLCARDFTGGWTKMIQYHDSYAKAMEQFNLTRSTKGSEMEHHQVRKFYADANKILNSTPQPMPGESAQEYFDRYREQLETVQASQYMKTKRECEEQRRKMDAYVQSKRSDITREYKESKVKLSEQQDQIRGDLLRVKEQQKILETRRVSYEVQRDELLIEISELNEKKQQLLDANSELSRKEKFYDDFFRRYDLLQAVDQDRAEQLESIMDQMESLDKEIQEIAGTHDTVK